MENVSKVLKHEYLSQQYYDKKIQELLELRLEKLTMEEYEKRFLEPISYVDFIQDEKVNIQRLLNGLSSFYKDQITYDESHTLKECIQKAK